MPEGYHKRKWRLHPQFGLKAAGDLHRLLKARCPMCQRTRYYNCADLAEVYGDKEVDDVVFRCPCGGRVRIELYTPKDDDVGLLEVLRPSGPKTVYQWRLVKLGDPRPS